jgi:hypothetical protein
MMRGPWGLLTSLSLESMSDARMPVAYVSGSDEELEDMGNADSREVVVDVSVCVLFARVLAHVTVAARGRQRRERRRRRTLRGQQQQGALLLPVLLV